MKLLLVDGSNIVMRAAFGGKLPPEQAVPVATGLIERAVRQTQATHLIVALDSPGPTWRHREFLDYQAHRANDTTPYLQASADAWTAKGWYVAALDGYEADDVIATLAVRVNIPVAVVSSDSDLAVLLARHQYIEIWKPVDGGKFVAVLAADVCEKYGISNITLLTQLKALMGEAGDNVPGVPGIGKVRAARALEAYGSIEAILTAGRAKQCPLSIAVAAYETRVRQALRLVTLSTDAPVEAIKPSQCRVRG